MGHSAPPAPPPLALWLLFLAISTWRTPSVSGYLNIFISHHEVMKLMGLEADLFYVHEGAINTYAMHFTVPVPADIHELEFSRQSLIAYPPLCLKIYPSP
ncbi:tyrosine-protein kinase Drl-like [Drosophila bipectinata]|uniref:tyrosine-protein kinase Drl-like n=1 Tax=Drosophila bipectinata TaxID=42026 RepID=UPI001C8AF89D|nr:tyrosine-protein kinase Drl-like [Drosophila bipectinata]